MAKKIEQQPNKGEFVLYRSPDAKVASDVRPDEYFYRRIIINNGKIK